MPLLPGSAGSLDTELAAGSIVLFRRCSTVQRSRYVCRSHRGSIERMTIARKGDSVPPNDSVTYTTTSAGVGHGSDLGEHITCWNVAATLVKEG
jgi:hypothetical protein